MNSHQDRLRRLRVLQRLALVAPNPMGELAILRELQTDPELEPTIEKVRITLDYLAKYELVRVIMVDDLEWRAARLTAAGENWLAAPSDLGLDIYSPGDLPEEANESDNRRGRVSSISVLPTEVKAWLDQELVRRGFSGYADLSGLLAERGYEISRSAIGRYGVKFKNEQQELRQNIEMAKAFAEVVGDDGAAMNQTLTALAQQELMTVIRDGQYDENIKLPELVKSIAALNRSDINTRKFQIEQSARRKALEDAADAVEKAAIEQKGMNKEQAQFWREQILGVR